MSTKINLKKKSLVLLYHVSQLDDNLIEINEQIGILSTIFKYHYSTTVPFNEFTRSIHDQYVSALLKSNKSKEIANLLIEEISNVIDLKRCKEIAYTPEDDSIRIIVTFY